VTGVVMAVRRHLEREPGYTALVWAWLTVPAAHGRHRAKVVGPATVAALLALAHHCDMQAASGGPRPASAAADLAVLTGLTAAHVGRLLTPLTQWEAPLVHRERGRGNEWLYRLTPPRTRLNHPPKVDRKTVSH
jgi:hypothetical protein